MVFKQLKAAQTSWRRLDGHNQLPRLAMTAPYVACLPKNGCMADYKADADLIEKLKKGRSLAIQAFDKGKPISFTLPLTGFAKAYEGPAGDPTGLQEGLSSELH